MPKIVITGFTGEQPRIIERLMPDTAAQHAINTRLDDGGLTPMRKPTDIFPPDPPKEWRTIYRRNGDWLYFEAIANIVPGPIAVDRLYMTGDGVPKIILEDGDIIPMAVPFPPNPLDTEITTPGAGEVFTRTYVYTWVSSLGEEGEPNAPSEPVSTQSDAVVTLTGFVGPAPGRLIDKMRIYRSQTGRTGTYFYFIAERDSSDLSAFVDDIAPDAFQEALPSADWNAPPNNLTGLIALPNGMMAGFVGNQLYFCEPYRPHAWPEKYIQTVTYPIVGLGAIGTTVVVMTTALPTAFMGSTPDTMLESKTEANLPCINPRGIVDMGYAIAYPTHDGLAVARGDGSIAVTTGNIWNRDGWQALKPQDFVSAQHGGRYVAFYRVQSEVPDLGVQGGALMIALDGQSFLVRSDVIGVSTFYDPSDGGLYFVNAGGSWIQRFDPPDGGRHDQYWKSKQFVLPYPENFSCILVDATDKLLPVDRWNLLNAANAAESLNNNLVADGMLMGAIADTPIGIGPINGDELVEIPATDAGQMTVGIYADGKLVRSVQTPNVPARLQAGFRARTWEIDVYGTMQVTQIAMATSMDLLKT